MRGVAVSVRGPAFPDYRPEECHALFRTVAFGTQPPCSACRGPDFVRWGVFRRSAPGGRCGGGIRNAAVGKESIPFRPLHCARSVSAAAYRIDSSVEPIIRPSQ